MKTYILKKAKTKKYERNVQIIALLHIHTHTLSAAALLFSRFKFLPYLRPFLNCSHSAHTNTYYPEIVANIYSLK